MSVYHRIRYKMIYWRGRFAHVLIRFAKRIMPDGHCMGQFRNPTAEMQNDLASCKILASRATSENIRLKARIALVAARMEDYRSEGSYQISDAIRESLTAELSRSQQVLLSKEYAHERYN